MDPKSNSESNAIPFIFSLFDAPHNFNRSGFCTLRKVPIGDWFLTTTSSFWNFRPGACRALLAKFCKMVWGVDASILAATPKVAVGFPRVCLENLCMIQFRFERAKGQDIYLSKFCNCYFMKIYTFTTFHVKIIQCPDVRIKVMNFASTWVWK